jgi:rSAM/selenodomain-associated transferase 2
VTRPDGIQRPRLSFVIPVWHEEENAPRLVHAIRALDSRDECEIVLVDGDEHASTLAAVEDDGVVSLTAPRGRAQQMNAGAAAARGEVLVFVHADTTLPPTAIDDIVGAVASGARAGAFGLCFDSDRAVYRAMSWYVTARTRMSRLPYGDQAIFIIREDFDRLGGYAPIPVMEDVDLVRRIRRAGIRLEVLPARVRTSCRRMEAEGVARRALLNGWIHLLFDLGVPPRTLARWYTDDHRETEHASATGTRVGEVLARHRKQT